MFSMSGSCFNLREFSSVSFFATLVDSISLLLLPSCVFQIYGIGLQARKENPNQDPRAPKMLVMKSISSILGLETILNDG